MSTRAKRVSTGRPSIFRGKAGKNYQGQLSQAGRRAFEDARRRLARLAKRRPNAISAADVIEYLARGESDTQRCLDAQAPRKDARGQAS